MQLNQAIELLKSENVSFVSIQEGKTPVIENEIGIKPIMICLRAEKQAFLGGVIADKIIGKAAALMMVLGGAKAVYGEIMSEAAVNIFEKNHIYFRFGTLVPYIENRQRTGRCPMEETVLNIEDPEIAFVELEKTIAQLMKKR